MKIIQLKCPSCGASLEAEDRLETFYCKYCGQKIILTEQDKFAIGAKVVRDVLNHRERMYEKRAEEDRTRRRENDRMVLIVIGFLFLAGILLLLLPK